MPSASSLQPAQQVGIAFVFGLVYLGMFLGGWPRLRLDRAGIALLGAIAMLAITGQTLQSAAQAVDLHTLVLLFAFMVISAQMRLGGFYTEVTRRVVGLPWKSPSLLAALLLAAAALSAVFSNDVVCLAMTPWVARFCRERALPPVPYLVGLACAANIGSAATLIGNPQNMLIGSWLALDFAHYSAVALAPVVVSLAALWGWLQWVTRHAPATAESAALGTAPQGANVTAGGPRFDRWQSAKGLTVAVLLLVIFLWAPWPRETVALVGAGVLLLSRRLHSAEVMGFVDWQLLLMFIGLFVVNQAFQQTGLPTQAVQALAAQGVHLSEPWVLLGLSVVLSNLVSNVPAVLLLLPHMVTAPEPSGPAAMGHLLALSSTFAGNLLLVGSIANLIVANLAEREGILISWRDHARVGLPVTLASMASLWLFAPSLRG
jgi:Na+/H+ antiporter NhaD/arsenite permease-like protein